MATKPDITPEEQEDAQIIWNYMKMNHTVAKSDLILCLGSYDIRVAEKAASLWHQGMADVILFSGNSGKLTEGLWNKPEAQVFRKRALELGVPDSQILVENKSTNTGENIKFSYSLLKQNNMIPRSLIIVQKPYMERRAYATFMKQWPGNTDDTAISVTSPDIDLLDYPNEAVGDLNDVICVLLGDMARIKLYEEKGFQIFQPVSDDAQKAFDKLKISGKFVSHMPVSTQLRLCFTPSDRTE